MTTYSKLHRLEKYKSQSTLCFFAVCLTISSCASYNIMEGSPGKSFFDSESYFEECLLGRSKYSSEASIDFCAELSILPIPGVEAFNSSVPPILGSPQEAPEPRLIRRVPIEGVICRNVFCGPNSVRITITSRPSGATVFVMGQFVGQTPMSLGVRRSSLDRISVRQVGSPDCVWQKPDVEEISFSGAFEMLCDFRLTDPD